MNELLLLKGNPSRRKSRKRRSPAQRAATRRMLAANRSRFGHNPSKRKRRRSVRVAGVVAHRTKRRIRRSFRSGGSVRSMGSGIAGMVKNGAIAGGGAVLADVGMGLIAKFAPTATTLTSRLNADGTMNYAYFATKGALIWAMSKYGSRVTRYAPTMAAGALAVMAYQLILSFMPTDGSIPLGYFNAGHIANGGNLGRITRNPGGVRRVGMQGLGRIMQLPAGAGKGAIAAATIRNMSAYQRVR